MVGRLSLTSLPIFHSLVERSQHSLLVRTIGYLGSKLLSGNLMETLIILRKDRVLPMGRALLLLCLHAGVEVKPWLREEDIFELPNGIEFRKGKVKGLRFGKALGIMKERS